VIMKKTLLFISLLVVTMVLGCDDDDSSENNNINNLNNSNNVNNLNNTNNVNNVNNLNNMDTCENMCDSIMACAQVPDMDLVLGETVSDCISKCNNTIDPYMKECLLSGGNCGDWSDCTRCLEMADVTFCDGACDLLVTTCGGENLSQCSIDCEMYVSGAAGCFHGAGEFCWSQVIEDESCQDIALCPTIH
jgi:hypothetical protein